MRFVDSLTITSLAVIVKSGCFISSQDSIVDSLPQGDAALIELDSRWKSDSELNGERWRIKFTSKFKIAFVKIARYRKRRNNKNKTNLTVSTLIKNFLVVNFLLTVK